MSFTRVALDKLRSEISKEEGITTGAVYDNEEMEVLLTALPKSIKQLEGLKGFPKGGARVTKWGARIVAAIKGESGVSNTKLSSFK